MTPPVSNDESSEDQKDTSKWSRNSPDAPGPTAPRHFAAVSLTPKSASRPGRKIRVTFLRRRFGRKMSRRLYEPEPVSQAHLRRRGYSVLQLIGWLAIVAACTGLIVLIAIITKPLWQDCSVQTI